MMYSTFWHGYYEANELIVPGRMTFTGKSPTPARGVLLDAAEGSEDERRPLNQRQFATYAPNVAYIRKPPRDYRVGAILSTIFCFLPLGVFALYYSFKTKSAYQQGNLSEAHTSSDRTKLLIQIAAISGCILWFSGVIAIIYFANKNL